MSYPIPTHLNPRNDPERARQLLAMQSEALASIELHIAVIEEGKARFLGRADFDDFLARLGRIRGIIERWEDPSAEQEDFELQFEQMMGEAAATLAKSTGTVMQQMSALPEEKLAEMTDTERAAHFDFVQEWERNKGDLLGILPIDERKRLEEE